MEQFYCWLAGLIDGDGCFSIPISHRIRKSKGKEWIELRAQVRIALKEKDSWALDYICQKANIGKIYFSNKGKPNSACSWQTTSWEDAIQITRRVLPYLVIKKEKANLFLGACERYVENYKGISIMDRMKGKTIRSVEMMLDVTKVATTINNDRQTERYREFKNFDYWKPIIQKLYENKRTLIQ